MCYSPQIHTTQAQTSTIPPLQIMGLVQNPQNLTLAQIEAMPQTTEHEQLYCVDNPNSPLDEGDWTGVQLSYLLQLVGVSPQAIKVAFYASDNFTTDLTVTKATNDNTVLVAYEENGAPCGLRLVVPGCWGYKWIYDLTQISLVDYNFFGEYEKAGYSDDAWVTDVRGQPIIPSPTTPPSPIATAPSTNPAATPVSPTPSPVQTLQTSAPSAASNLNPKSTQTLANYLIPIFLVALIAVAASTIVLTKRRPQKSLNKS